MAGSRPFQTSQLGGFSALRDGAPLIGGAAGCCDHRVCACDAKNRAPVYGGDYGAGRFASCFNVSLRMQLSLIIARLEPQTEGRGTTLPLAQAKAPRHLHRFPNNLSAHFGATFAAIGKENGHLHYTEAL